MNEIHHYRLVIDLDIWSAFKQASQNDIDDLICQMKEKKLLSHCGNVKTVIQCHKVEKAN